MYSSTPSSGDTSIYWPLLRNISIEEKLHLIVKLSDSVASIISKPKESETEYTARFIAKYCGSWKGDTSAEEIITAIRNDRSDRDPISFD